MTISHNDNTNKKQGWNVKEAKTSPLENLKQRVNLKPEEFDLFIKQQGIKVKVYRTMYCPNVKSLDGAEHDIDCQITGCNGSGFLDVRPIETYAFIQNQSLEKIDNPEGLIDGNSVAATFLSGIELQYFTLIELCDFSDIFFERIQRSSTNIDNLKYRSLRVNVVIDQNGIEYFECIDFTLNKNGSIQWKENKGPSEGTIYSIHYESKIQFRATRSMHSNRFSTIKTTEGLKSFKLPEQWQLTREFLVKREDEDNNEIHPNPL